MLRLKFKHASKKDLCLLFHFAGAVSLFRFLSMCIPAPVKGVSPLTICL